MQSKIVAQKQLYATHSYSAKLQQATILLEEQDKEKHTTLIQKDVNIVNKNLEHLIFLRNSLRDITREIKILEGTQEYGPEVSIMGHGISILKFTLRKLKRLREKKDFLPRKGLLSNEGEIWNIFEQINTIYKNERGLLQKALPDENLEFIAEQDRHRLNSYTIVPIIESQTRKKKEESDLIDFDEKPKSFWSYKSFFGFKDPSKDVQNTIVTPTSGNKVEGKKFLKNLDTKSLL